MRLAQRSYRVKKEDALRAATEKSARLETAMRGMLDSFKTFQETLVNKADSGAIPQDLALHISKAAIQIATISKDSGLHGQTASQATVTADASKPQDGQNAARRFAQASMEHTVKMVAADTPTQSCLPPALLEHLNLSPGQILLAQTLGQFSETDANGPGDIPYAKPVVDALSPMFRINQGDTSQLLPRQPPPHLQRLTYGMTRTILATNLPELMGEWLEPPDVEEYLAQRGILVRENATTDFISLQVDAALDNLPPQNDDQYGFVEFLPSAEDWINDPELEIPDAALDWTIFGCIKYDGQTIPSGMRTITPLATSDIVTEGTQASTLSASEPRTPLNGQFDSTITIDVSRLIDGLAARARCLGPGPGIRREGIDEAIREAVV